jgi:predicted RND superfamily exporter protein
MTAGAPWTVLAWALDQGSQGSYLRDGSGHTRTDSRVRGCPAPTMTTLPAFTFTATAIVIAATAFAAGFPATVIRYARTVLSVLILVSVAALAMLVDARGRGVRIDLDPSEEPMLPINAPTRPIYADAIRNFGDDDLFIIGMRTTGVFSHDNLQTLRTIGHEIRRLPGVRSAENLTDTTSYDYDHQRDLVDVGNLIDEIPTEAAALARLQARATTDRVYPKTIVSRDGTTAAINVAFRTMTDGEFVRWRLDESIHSIVGAHASPAREFFITGRKHIKARAHHLMVNDLVRLIPLAVAVGAVVAWIVTGSLRAGVIPVGASLIATLWAFGFLAFLDHPLNLITLVLGPMLICVGSVYGVHIIARYDAIAAERGVEAPALVCLRYTRTPVLIAGLTTCIGFSALLISDTPAIAELGALSVLGIAAVTLISLTGLPALFHLFPHRGPPPRASLVMHFIVEPALVRISRLVTERPGVALGLWMVFLVGALAAIPRTIIDTDYLSFFDVDSRVRKDFAAISESIVGAVPIYVTLAGDGNGEGTFREPRNLRAVKSLQQRIDDVPGVSATLSVVDLVEVLNRAIEKDDPAAERIPDTRGEVAELMFLIPKKRLRRFANANHSRTNIVVRTGASGSASILELERRLREVIAAEPLPADIDVEITGNAIVLNKAADGVARDQFATVGVAATAIFLLIAYAFGSPRLGLLAMIPNIVPVAMFFGLLGAGVAPLSLPTSLIGCIALGIAIDDTAHFLVGYRHQRALGADPPGAADVCLRTLGKPIATTSLMLAAGFLVLFRSEFATLREFGYLSAITMVFCLGADLVLLPAVLTRIRA